MRAVENDEEWGLTSPKDGTVLRKISARDLWIRILTARVETGEPYLIFIDHVNRAIPEHHKLAGLHVKMSNLCTEITLPTGRDKDGGLLVLFLVLTLFLSRFSFSLFSLAFSHFRSLFLSLSLSWEPLGAFGVLLGHLGGLMGSSGGLLGATLGLRGVSLGHFCGSSLLRIRSSLLFETLGEY